MLAAAMDELLLLLLGSLLTLAGVFVKAWIDAASGSSALLFERRLDALHAVWERFNTVRRIYGAKISLGHTRWLAERGDEAKAAVDEFRSAIDNSQITLDASVVAVFYELDQFFYLLLFEDENMPGAYARDLRKLLNRLQEAIQKNMRSHYHQITLITDKRREKGSEETPGPGT